MGLPLAINSLAPKLDDRADLARRLTEVTYVGIDFGTSTSVASYAVLGDADVPLKTEPIPIPQSFAVGRTMEYHLVPTAVAWFEERLLVGAGAAELRKDYRQGRSVWSSFKMELGVDLGPRYYNSELPRNHPVATIETPRDAARVFLQYLKEHVEAFIEREGLPARMEYAVSIPASFEANQRQDLLYALRGAGIALPEQAFIDEPNAAFLSYLTEANMNLLGNLNVPSDAPLHILVFDFGAGTCDISILEVGQEKGRIYSKNLAISRFEALGGDDIDREIVRRVLIPQLLDQNNLEPHELKLLEIEKRIVPVLMRAAEVLKIRLCKSVSSQMIGTTLPRRATSDEAIELDDSTSIQLMQRVVTLDRPSITFAQFAEVMRPFLRPPSAASQTAKEVVSIFEPVDSALMKADMKQDELDLVLLIGGSSENPYVQAALHEWTDAEVEIPRDLRSHVSTGAGIHSLLLNGLGTNLIRPITSEPILVVTRDGTLRTLVRAGTEIPSAEIVIDDLYVAVDGQAKIEVPICVSSENKILQVIEIESRSPAGFDKGTRVRLTCRVTADKVFEVNAAVGEQEVAGKPMNPFGNRPMTPEERAVADAERAVNQVAARNGGRPTTEVLLQLKKAYVSAGEYSKAAELVESIASMDRNTRYETSLCYLYSKAGNERLSLEWARRAHEVDPDAVSAFNLAVSLRRGTEEYGRLLEESLEHNPTYSPSMVLLGQYLMAKGQVDRGKSLIQSAFDDFYSRFQHRTLHRSEYFRLIAAAESLGRDEVVKEVRQRQKLLRKSKPAGYDQANAPGHAGQSLVPIH